MGLEGATLWWEKYLSKLDVDFYDIGASEGIFSIVFSHFNKKNNVYAFEPSTKSYNIMLKNIKLNNRKYYIGIYDLEEDAARAYDNKNKKYF